MIKKLRSYMCIFSFLILVLCSLCSCAQSDNMNSENTQTAAEQTSRDLLNSDTNESSDSQNTDEIDDNGPGNTDGQNTDDSENSDEQDNSLEKLSGKNIGIVTGSIFDQIAEEVIPDCHVIYYNSHADLATALDNGKIDGYFTDEPIARILINPILHR